MRRNAARTGTRPGTAGGRGDGGVPTRPAGRDETSGDGVGTRQDAGGEDAAGPSSAPLRGGQTASAVQWNSLAVAGRQVFQFACAIVLARILGPESYGVISAATVYITFTTLLLDQGLSSALIQRPDLSRWAPGAAATLNLASGVVLAAATWVCAPLVADFFSVDALTGVLRLLGVGLVVKSAAVAPRAMASRALTFRPIALADISGAAVGAVLGITAALLGAGPHAVVFQVVATDAVVATMLLRAGRGPVPNLRLRELGVLLPFGTRVMATNGIAYFSRNIDNILVGRFLGVVSLSLYGMAYRVLVIPVQMIGQTVSRVMFPVFSRVAAQRDVLAQQLLVATELLAVVTVPLMAALAVSSSEVVPVVLGDEWRPAAPLLTILAIAGARETIFYVTGPLMKATGHVRLLVRYELLATGVQVTGIVVGLQLGVVGVAAGYTLAGFALMPVLMTIQRRLTGVSLAGQLVVLWPPVHASLWASGAYVLVRLVGLGPLATLVLGGLVYGVVLVGVLWLVHRTAAGRALLRLRTLLPGRLGGVRHAG